MNVRGDFLKSPHSTNTKAVNLLGFHKLHVGLSVCV